MESFSVKTIDEAVEEIMRLHKSLPERPGLDEVEAAAALVMNVEKEDQVRLEAIERQTKSGDVPEELFMVLQEMQRNLVFYQSKEQKREALKLLDLENVHVLFDELIQRASKCLPSAASSPSSARSNKKSPPLPPPRINSNSNSPMTTTPIISSNNNAAITTPTSASAVTTNFKTKSASSQLFTRDDSYVKKSSKPSFYSSDSVVPSKASAQIFDSTLKGSAISG